MWRWLGALAAGSLLCAPAAGAAPPLQAYGKLPGIEDVAMSPSGESYAFIALVGDSRKLVVVGADGKARVEANVGAAKIEGVWWAGEDHVLAATHATVTLGPGFTVWRDEMIGVGALNLRTGKLTPIFKGHPQVMNAVFGYYGEAQVGGRWYGYFGGVTLEQGKAPDDLTLGAGVQYPDLYQVDLDTGEPRLVTHGSVIGDGWLVGPDGTVIARRTYDPKTSGWEIRAGTLGGNVLAGGRSAFGGASLMRGRTPDSVLIHAPSNEDGAGVYQEISLATGEVKPVADSQEIEDIVTDPQTGLRIGVAKRGDEPEVEMFDPVMNARAKGTRKAFPKQSVRLVASNRDFSRLIVFTSGPGDSGTYWTVQIAGKGSADPFGAAYPDVREADVGEIRMVDWKASDGLALRGVLSLPAGRLAKDLPVVVMPHGGPEARDYPVFDWWAQAFASQGYAVFQPNFRGSDGYGLAFRNAGFGEFGRKMQTDISDGLTELAREGVVDPKRACIVGASYGGYAALAGVTLQQGFYRCSVAVAGISDLVTFARYVHDKEGDDYVGPGLRYWRSFVGDHPDEVSPIRFASRADAPILLIHGKDDTVVPIDQSQRMAAALKAAGKPVELVVMPSEDHWLSREEARELMLKSAVAFVEKYDPPDAAPAPSRRNSPSPR